MVRTIYIENDIRDHPRTLGIQQRFPNATRIYCDRYTEVFNRKAQNFRLQKKQPALILARKFKNHVLPTPVGYGLGAKRNYYFSHMLNCIYDCRYCFLQGMFRSAHYVLFVNYEDYIDAINEVVHRNNNESLCFFSGYDCDSLAMEPVTRFSEYFLPFFENYPTALLEIRTKSTQIRSLLAHKPVNNCIVAYSFTPPNIAMALEHKTPTIENRITAITRLQEKGWLIGLRFDPIIFDDNYKINYANLFKSIFNRIDLARVHSVSLGSFRLPKDYYRKIRQLYPEELLFSSPLEEINGLMTYTEALQSELLGYCTDKILAYIPHDKFFPCHNWT
jgi:spore photoproduct lyase